MYNLPLHIEEIADHNLEPLAKLMVELWPSSTFDKELADSKMILASDDRTCYLGMRDEGYHAFAYVAMRSDAVEGAGRLPVAYLEGIYVRPAFRGSGMGRSLLEAVEQWCRDRGCRQLASDTELNNERSETFHRQAGFNEVNRVICFIKDL